MNCDEKHERDLNPKGSVFGPLMLLTEHFTAEVMDGQIL